MRYSSGVPSDTISPSTAMVLLRRSVIVHRSTMKLSSAGERAAVFTPRATALSASASMRPAERPCTTSTCSPRRPCGTLLPSVGSFNSRSPTPMKTTGVRYVRRVPSTSSSTVMRRSWKRMRNAAIAEAILYPKRGSRYSRTFTKWTYAPTLLVLRKRRSFTMAASAGRAVPLAASTNASSASPGMPRSVAKWLRVPPGRMASSPVPPTMADAAVAIVPSPPATSTRVFPSATA